MSGRRATRRGARAGALARPSGSTVSVRDSFTKRLSIHSGAQSSSEQELRLRARSVASMR